MMKRCLSVILVVIAALSALTVGAFAAVTAEQEIDWTEMSDGTFEYEPVYVTGNINSQENIKAYKVKKYIGEQEDAVIPDRFHGKPVTEIGVVTTEISSLNETVLKEASVFAQNGYFEGSVTIPNSITVINSGAFAYASVTEIVIPGSVKTIGTYAFVGCSDLQNIQILDYADATGKIRQSHTEIKAHAFEDCGYVTSLAIPNSVNAISNSAFKGCSSLKELVLPPSVKTIAEYAFADCNNLLNVTVLGSNVNFDSTSFAWKKVFEVKESKPGYFHCGYSDTISNIGTILGALNLQSWELRQFKERIHSVTIQSDGLTVTGRTTTPVCKATGPNGKATLSFTCNGYDENVEVKDETTGNTTTETVHRDCACFNGKDSYSQTPDVSAVYHNEQSITEVVGETCAAPGLKGGTRCAFCNQVIEPQEVTPPTGLHTYDEDSKTVEHLLYEGYCGDGSKGLILVTRSCTVCGHTPTCWTCQKLEWELAEANGVLVAAQEVYADALAKEQDAIKALEDAEATKTAAAIAVAEAEKKVADAQAAADEAKAKLDGLGDTATDEERAAAQKALDDANETLLDAKMAKDEIDRAEAAALDAAAKAKAEKDAATEALTSPTDLKAAVETAQNGASNKKMELSGHVKLTTAGSHRECSTCNDLRKAIDAATGSAKKKAEEAYADHLKDQSAHSTALLDMTEAVGTREADEVEHVWGEDYEKVVTPAVCGSTELGKTEVWHKCTICQEEELKETITTRPDKQHTPDPSAKPELIKKATCTETGQEGYAADVKCVKCGEEIGDGFIVVISELGHDWETTTEETGTKPTCTEAGEAITVTIRTCKREDCPLKTEEGPYQEREEGEPVPISALGHDWDNFVPYPDQDATQAEDCTEKEVKGTAICTRNCGVPPEERTITIPGKLGHTWGEWVIDTEKNVRTRTCKVCGKTEEQPLTPCTEHTWGDWTVVTEPTATTEGLRKRVCKICGTEETEKIPALGESPDDPNKPDPDADYTITVVQGSGGSASASRSSAKAGTSVTITVTPGDGYELDMIRIIAGGTRVINYTNLGGNQYRFTMPSANVNITVSFERLASGTGWGGVSGDPSTSGDPPRTQITIPTQITSPASVPRASAWNQLFFDIPISHWAAGEINWANQMGYMGGSNGRFDPDGVITAQQVWMVLARFMGTYPANMTEAWHWAVNSGFAAGGDPNAAMTRHQVITALYRCAALRGRSTRPSNLTLAGYTDSSLVPASARDAMIWAVANGIIAGDSDNRLNPTSTVTRAQFAVILYRFSQRV